VSLLCVIALKCVVALLFYICSIIVDDGQGESGGNKEVNKDVGLIERSTHNIVDLR